jgi:hypothetical protein
VLLQLPDYDEMDRTGVHPFTARFPAAMPYSDVSYDPLEHADK